jgi:cell wall-associated NlpC family hydrolase
MTATMDAELIGIKGAILTHARECAPEECCGFIVSHGGKIVTVPCMNMAEPDRVNYFRTDPRVHEDIENAGALVVGIYHSHPNGLATLSDGDVADCEAQRLPYVVVGWPSDEERQAGKVCAPARVLWETYTPCGKQFPYEGRPFVHGSLDCYTLIRDWYERELGVLLPNFARPDNWWVKGENLYVDNIETTHFVRVRTDEMRHGDVLLFSVMNTPVPNHAAIYLGDGEILHHPPARMSCRAPYVCDQGYYGKHLWGAFRHETQIDAAK